MDVNKLYELERALKENNPFSLFKEYVNIFENSKIIFPIKFINKDDIYYRARIGCQSMKGAIDDLDCDIEFPYYGGDIGAAPPLLTKGGRFNREGTSFLYLGSDVDTCIAELRCEVNQKCTVAGFVCRNEAKYLDLDSESDHDVIKVLKTLMLEPVHSEIKYRYLITQFLSEVFREIGFDGIYFKSTLSEGKNLVCFNPSYFEYEMFTERMYKTVKVKYFTEEVEESYKEYRDYRRGLSSYNSSEEEKKDKILEYIDSKIQYEYNRKIDKYIEKIEGLTCFDEIISIYNEMVTEFNGDMIMSNRVFNIRGDYYRDSNMFNEALKDYYDSEMYCRGLISEEDLLAHILHNIKVNSKFCDGNTDLMSEKIKVFIKESKEEMSKKKDDLINRLKDFY